MGQKLTKMNDAQIEELRSDVREIKLAILGQKHLGHVGLVERVAEHDRRLSYLERIALWGAGALAVVSIVFQLIKEKVLN